MSDDATPRLGLPYLAASQAQKHVTLNEAFSRLDGLVQTAFESRTLADQPAGPGEGAIYILPADAVGAAWAGQPAGAAMRFEASGWSPMPVAEGHLAWVKDEGLAIVRSGDGWTALVGDGEPSFQNLPLLGVGTTADAANPLAVKAGGVLLAARGAGEGGDGDLRVTLNKEAADDTASLVFQSGWSGRAEFGLAGTEDFSVKVSPDGSVWHPAVTIARATGKATFALSPARPSEVTVFTASGDYAIPAWARRLALICIGGGGGGGSGSSGTNAANRSGGAGGGGGGRSRDEIDVSDLTGSPLSITVGDGGAGGAGVTGGSVGIAGAAGGDSSVSDGAQVLIAAGGGSGGAGGSSSNSNGGAGGYGDVAGNAGGGGSTANAAFAGDDRSCGAGPGGGGGAGGLNTSSTTTSGKDGGHGYLMGQGGGRRATRGSGGAAGGSGGAGAAKAWQRGCGAGGGGGGGIASTNGGSGGPGGDPGGGGGGGGACRDTHTSGSGGAGGRGEVWIIAIG